MVGLYDHIPEDPSLKLRCLCTAVLALLVTSVSQASVVIVPPRNPSPVQKLAAKELQRYIYLRTGKMPEVSVRPSSQRIVLITSPKSFRSQEYQIRTTHASGRTTWQIVGGDDTGVLYGAYRFAEKLGVRFYLQGDVIPDKRLAKLPVVNETGKPVFSIRGINPFHDFPEGPDWWNTDDYITYISQLAKMRMNFIGLHCHPEGLAEPSVWIGTKADLEPSGQVRFSYPTRWANTAIDSSWGYSAMPTSEYSSGASLLFSDDKYVPETMTGMLPYPPTPERSNKVFNDTGNMFHKAFSYARALGVKTCVGTEMPLTIPALVRERLKQQGKDPADPKVVQEVYEGMFSRIAKVYPVDYYWLWTSESWTWGGNTEEDIKATTRDIQCAQAALDSLGNPFTLATCGWVLGPVQDRTALDKVLRPESPMSCINRNVGHDPVEPGFADIKGRPKWAIPWMENDPDLTAPQPWVGRMRYDAADARWLGCTGLLGIHWRTKIMSQNVAALAAAGWDQSWAPADFLAEKTELERKDGPLSGKTVTYPNPIENTDEDPIYQSVRYDVKGYRLAIPSGKYTVTLKFNEPAYAVVGKRVFSVNLQGKQVIEHLDIFARVGQNKALDFTFPDIVVDDSSLKIDFEYEFEYPCIAGIVIQGLDNSGKPYVRKINCGGERYGDYEPDVSAMDNKADQRTMPTEDFYYDFARANFGSEVAVPAGKIMASIDNRKLPDPVHWVSGPGGLRSDREPWETVRLRYSFVDDLEALRSRIGQPGDFARFDYWLNSYRYMRGLAHLACVRGELDAKIEAITAEKDPDKQRRLLDGAVDLRIGLSRLWEQTITLQLQAVDTPGEIGTIDNLERQSRKTLQFLTKHDEFLGKTLGSPLPKEIELSKSYDGPARIILPTVCTQARAGESLRLKIIIMDNDRPSDAALYWRPLGIGQYRKVDLQNLGRATYEAKLPPASGSFEYYVTAKTPSGKLVWPATAPEISQTVVVW
jgi:hypothetical protein